MRTVGKEDVRGEETTHYRATVDLERYPELLPERDRAAARATVQQLVRLSGSSTTPVEVWVDGDGLVRRMRQELRTQVAPGKRGTIDQEYELYDFGREVDVEIPSGEQVRDVTELASQAGGQGAAAAP